MRMYNYPLWYYNKKPNSDIAFIESRLSVIPEKFKGRVCTKYENIYRSDHEDRRKLANTYINKVAKRFYAISKIKKTS